MIWLMICLVIKNFSLAFIKQFYFAVPKNIRLHSKHYFILNIPSKWELQQIAFSHSSDIDFKGVINLYKNILKNHILS